MCLAEVAVAGGSIVGHAQRGDAPIVVDGRVVKGAYLTCPSTEPALQRRGVGSRLVRGGLGRVHDRGYQAATLLGSELLPALRLSPELAERIAAPHLSRGRGFQAIELVLGVLHGIVVPGDFPAVIAPA